MTTPRVEIDLGKITQNAQCLVRRLGPRGISVTGVTKAVCGHPDVAKAMLSGGVADLADSRVSNVIRMRAAGIACPISMIRAPVSHSIEDVVRCCDTSYNTEIDTIRKLGSAAREQGTEHHVILMVEMGDLRDGIMPEDLNDVASRVVATPGVILKGIAANFACMGITAPTVGDMAMLSRLADQVEAKCGPHVALVSGGSSANLAWALGQRVTGRINNLRLGEAILLGIDPVSGQPIHGLHTDAFALFAEVIETGLKPCSMPKRPEAPKHGTLELILKSDYKGRSVLAVGQQDTDASGLTFPSGVKFIGATSDHLVVDTSDADMSVGSEMKISMNYSALMRSMSAPDVEKRVDHGLQIDGAVKGAKPQPRLRLV
ncbi:alanine/ornithine racemase family PLP-dependent enzyme [Aestuariivita sp.]|jgi:predicted amino acid racemase|uniref:alanine/ornithine racemase family PLP-dependent enzyme n=1 Tax=Aestuariivita sp. TaxID=1872407 RepID=UPI00216BC3C0|nr:alanine/ornithine racemase family PLP-dependent enzyme [Aestuariivita sp.]MCE8007950.1 alanine/ornithine racemase family PLP-dependent enzyme [Aestuariivita sp.]